jgi:hypothetical protein
MTRMITGGCLCGAVRYEADGEPLFAVLCHCRDCQRLSGTGHVPVMGMPRASFKETGATRVFNAGGGSGSALRHFCPVCGSLVFGESGLAPDAISIYVGTFDDPSIFKPEMALFTAQRHAWDHVTGDFVEFEGMPPPDRSE